MMSSDFIASWRELSPWLDEVLKLDQPARKEWLNALATTEPRIAAGVRELLQEHAALERLDFMSGNAPAPESTPSLSGAQVGAYTLDSMLGVGSSGSVWLAHRSDGRFEGLAAVKLLSAALIGRPSEERFRREGQVLARLDHPNIAHLIDAGITASAQPYLVLEYVEGARLDEYCEQQRLGVEARVRLFLDVLAAAAHAHSHLIVHRDLKPSNILVTNSGVVKLLDFGVAALLAPNDETRDLTREAGVGLTPEYAAPEQLLGQPVTTATDVYALGLVLYVLLTDQHPRAQGSPAELMRHTLEADAPPPSRIAADVQRRRQLRGDLDNIIATALRKDPAQRYQTAAAFADDLRRFLNHEPVTARPQSAPYRIRKFARRHRVGLASGLAAALALIATTGVAISQMYEARRQRNHALEQSKVADGYSTIIISLLSQLGPGGRALQPGELLDRAVLEVERRYADDPAAQARMLVRISGRYYDLRDTNKEYATLLKAERLARVQGDAVTLLNVECSIVETDIDAGRREQARARVVEMRQLLARTRPSPLEHAGCLRAEAQLARADGELPAAISSAERAREVLEQAERTSGNVYAGIISMLASFHTQLGLQPQAHRYYELMNALDRKYARVGSVGGLIGQLALADSHYQMGQITLGREGAAQALQGWSALPDSPSLIPSLAYRYGEMLSRAGRHEEALALMTRAVSDADAGGNKSAAGRARTHLARALLRAQQIDAADEAQEAALRVLLETDAPGSAHVIDALHVRAMVRLAQQRLDAAEQDVREAQNRLGRDPRYFVMQRAMLLATQARIDLARNDAASAARHADAAAELFARNSIAPTSSADVGEALLIRAQAEAARDPAAAAITRRRATEMIERAMRGARESL